MTFPVTVRDVDLLIISHQCTKTSPCKHQCQIQLFNKRSASVRLPPSDISLLIGALDPSRIIQFNPPEHFEVNPTRTLQDLFNECFPYADEGVVPEILGGL